jgi:hypothetical protein
MLAREVAFFMLREMGYSAEEAHRAVGIDRFYYRKETYGERAVRTELGVKRLKVAWTLGPETPLLTWVVGPDGGYPEVFVVWGCYAGGPRACRGNTPWSVW